ncbi:MAG: hypothetical protein R3252_11220 [Robiginitalea sp.]|nr:hypothetical protein [Robiginitalea sp.]
MSKHVKFRDVFFVGFLSFLITSCSLVKIESEQQPLSVNELNTRLLIQAFAEEALERTEIAADSILKETEGRLDIQKNALRWKIQTASALGRISFLFAPEGRPSFGPGKPRVLPILNEGRAVGTG